MSPRIAVIGDIHGNGRALAAALSVADATGYDELIFIGDLLTYGVDSQAVLETVGALSSRPGVTVLLGNHDAIYLEPDSPDVRRYLATLQPWVRECIEYTARVAPLDQLAALPFVTERVVGQILFAHANPYGDRDWRYLNTDAEHADAIRSLGDRGMLAGVFGHTHRCTLVHSDGCSIQRHAPGDVPHPLAPEYQPYVFNVGSIGQPRSADKTAYVGIVDHDASRTHVALVRADYDIAAHVSAVRASRLSETTLERLVSFFP